MQIYSVNVDFSSPNSFLCKDPPRRWWGRRRRRQGCIVSEKDWQQPLSSGNKWWAFVWKICRVVYSHRGVQWSIVNLEVLYSQHVHLNHKRPNAISWERSSLSRWGSCCTSSSNRRSIFVPLWSSRRIKNVEKALEHKATESNLSRKRGFGSPFPIFSVRRFILLFFTRVKFGIWPKHYIQ